MDALILAGGENKRMPVIKAFIEVNRRRIIDSNVELLKRMFNRVIICTNNPELYFYIGVPMVGDIIDYRSPMTGIFSALTIPGISGLFVIACDMPFINAILVKYIVDKWKDEWDALIPIFKGKPQPLHGIYSKKIIKSMEKEIKHGRRSLIEFLRKINVSYINDGEVRSIDPEGKSFVNINTLRDFEKEIGGKICLG
ncbi:MAG: molybdenum cofactor guanylyltransferase [Nitrospirae bacterium]|jgi:molybdenum cofactor guanylyltransferase|nr:molybdenum cofactor guanylyltransferase [Nitrospirota bacterium]